MSGVLTGGCQECQADSHADRSIKIENEPDGKCLAATRAGEILLLKREVDVLLWVESGNARPYRERMAKAHLLFGYLGSGKTTFAKRLEVEHGAVRFTPDEWMARLFGCDPPEESFPEKAEAILKLLEPLWTRCLSLGLDVVLDYGFWTRKERDEVRGVVERLGASACLYRLECSDDEARRRIDARNKADSRTLYIASATYDALWRRFEPLDVDEACVEVVIRTPR